MEKTNGRIETVPPPGTTPVSKLQESSNFQKVIFVAIGDSMQESKMKAALGKNVKISLPKALQTSKEQTKSLAVKGAGFFLVEGTGGPPRSHISPIITAVSPHKM